MEVPRRNAEQTSGARKRLPGISYEEVINTQSPLSGGGAGNESLGHPCPRQKLLLSPSVCYPPLITERLLSWLSHVFAG